MREGFAIRTNTEHKSIFKGFYYNDHRQGLGWIFGQDKSEFFGYFVNDEKHGCCSLKFPRGTIVDREYQMGNIVSELKSDDKEWPPSFASHYEPNELKVVQIQLRGNSNSLVCVCGNWDKFETLTPLGYDKAIDIHCIVLTLKPGKYHFRFVVDGCCDVIPNHLNDIENQNGVQYQTLNVF